MEVGRQGSTGFKARGKMRHGTWETYKVQVKLNQTKGTLLGIQEI